MFTGIVQSVGTITSLRNKDGAVFCEVNPSIHRKWNIGESVAVNGICSTITSSARNSFRVVYMPHTVSLTTIGQWRHGTRVNIEPSLKAGDEISGHFVMGHVDGTARITAIQHKSGQTSITVQVPKNLIQYNIPRGSITLDGINLTVAGVRKDAVVVEITPYTLSHTTLQYATLGDFLNLEIDTFARYLLWNSNTSKRKKRA